MKKGISLILGILIITLTLSGCSNSLKDENLSLKKQVNSLRNENEILKEKMSKINKDYKDECELRNILDVQFYNIVNSMRDGNLKDLKELVSSDASIAKNKITFGTGKQKDEFRLPPSKAYFRQRYFTLSKDKKTFESAYEIRNDGDAIYQCIACFTIENAKWKLSDVLYEQ